MSVMKHIFLRFDRIQAHNKLASAFNVSGHFSAVTFGHKITQTYTTEQEGYLFSLLHS